MGFPFTYIADKKSACNVGDHSSIKANLENSAVATGLEKVHFHSNPKERQCQRIFKLSHNCTHVIQLAK